MKKALLSKLKFTPFLIVIIVILALWLYLKDSGCKGTGCLEAPYLNKYKLEETYEDEKNIYRALYKDNDRFLRLEVRSELTDNEATKRIEAQITRMKALFENAISPYPGMISDEIECGEKFRPNFYQTPANGINFSYFSGYLNSRLSFGACTEDQAKYTGVFAMFYCPKQNKLYQLELIAPNQPEMDKTISQKDLLDLECKNLSGLKLPGFRF